MRRKTIAIVTLAAFCFFSFACSFTRVQVQGDRIRAQRKGEKNIVGVRTKSEVLDFQDKRPARVEKGAVVGRARRILSIDPAEMVEARRTGKTASILMTDGKSYEVLSASRDGDRLSCTVLDPTSIPLTDVECVWVRKADAGKTALNVLAWTVVLPLMVLLVAVTSSEEDVADGLVDIVGGLGESGPAPAKTKALVEALFPDAGAPRTADQTEFLATEWAPVVSAADQKGAYRLDYGTGVEGAASLDMAELIIVDHSPGVFIAPDAWGMLHSYASPVPPVKASDQTGSDIAPLLAAKDAKFWESPGSSTKADKSAPSRDELVIEFARPQGSKRAHLVVNATNSIWGAELARRSRGAKGTAIYDEREFTSLKIEVETKGGWQARQLVHGGGPLSPEDAICPLDLTGIEGSTLRLRFTPPSGYWVFDRLAMDFTEDQPLEALRISAAEARDPEDADALAALAEEDGRALVLENGRETIGLTFDAPPLEPGKERTAFLRTVTAYSVPPEVKPVPKR